MDHYPKEVYLDVIHKAIKFITDLEKEVEWENEEERLAFPWCIHCLREWAQRLEDDLQIEQGQKR